jgi:hypothetical protein
MIWQRYHCVIGAEDGSRTRVIARSGCAFPGHVSRAYSAYHARLLELNTLSYLTLGPVGVGSLAGVVDVLVAPIRCGSAPTGAPSSYLAT